MSGGRLLTRRDAIGRLKRTTHSPAMRIKFFSGGNQQKAVIGKWMSAKADIYVFVEPTSGVDVGAIKEIYDIILHWRAAVPR